MSCTLVYRDEMAAYDFGAGHPLRPERVTLAIDLMREYGLFAEGSDAVTRSSDFPPASDGELALVHDRDYLDVVRAASADPQRFAWRSSHGIGPGDTPAAPRLHETAALICGGTIAALRTVLEESGGARSFAIAGGLHHAHRDRAAGFCVYNDPAVAISVARAARPDLRVAYLDIDAHHGDGVQEAFYDDPHVLTISLHESGRYLYPGTGRITETGTGAGAGFSLNVPLPPFADGACYGLAFDDVVSPALSCFAPDVLVAQCGADAHHADPLTHLGLTLAAMKDLHARIITLAEQHCDGRLVCTGGGGYGAFSAVPRVWTMLAAALGEAELSDELPQRWRERSSTLSGSAAPRMLLDEHPPPPIVNQEALLRDMRAVIRKLRQSSPLLPS